MIANKPMMHAGRANQFHNVPVDENRAYIIMKRIILRTFNKNSAYDPMCKNALSLNLFN